MTTTNDDETPHRCGTCEPGEDCIHRQGTCEACGRDQMLLPTRAGLLCDSCRGAFFKRFYGEEPSLPGAFTEDATAGPFRALRPDGSLGPEYEPRCPCCGRPVAHLHATAKWLDLHGKLLCVPRTGEHGGWDRCIALPDRTAADVVHAFVQRRRKELTETQERFYELYFVNFYSVRACAVEMGCADSNVEEMRRTLVTKALSWKSTTSMATGNPHPL